MFMGLCPACVIYIIVMNARYEAQVYQRVQITLPIRTASSDNVT